VAEEGTSEENQKLLGAAGREPARICWRRGRRCRIADRLKEKGARGWIHGIGEWARLDWSRASPPRIPGAGGLHRCTFSLPLSLSPSPSLSRSESESGHGKCRRLGKRFRASFSRARVSLARALARSPCALWPNRAARRPPC